jgi:hypothetical protein
VRATTCCLTALSLCLGASACDVFNAPEPVGFNMPVTTRDPSATQEAGLSALPEVDTSAALEAIADGGYRSAAFVHATKTPYASAAVAGALVDEWVSASAYAEYSKVQPDATGSGAQLAPGSMIVRAVVDSNDVVSKLTVMMKGPSGYNPALGDWWFGETDPSGLPLTDDAGALTGRLSDCYACHIPRSGDDYLFGIPTSDRPTTD